MIIKDYLDVFLKFIVTIDIFYANKYAIKVNNLELN